MMIHMPDISDYDKSGYDYTKYWIDRQYEDFAEKRVLNRLLPNNGGQLLDLGGSFGRFATTYCPRYKKAIILDFSKQALEQANHLAKRHNITNLETIWGNAYHTPFEDKNFDTVLLIRVLHHIKNIPALFTEIYRVLKPNGTLIIEMANKIHLKSTLSNLVKGKFNFRHDLSPIQLSGTNGDEESGIFYNFHPDDIKNKLAQSFIIDRKISANNLRLPPNLKKRIPIPILLALDQIIEPIFTLFNWGPSVWFRCHKKES